MSATMISQKRTPCIVLFLLGVLASTAAAQIPEVARRQVTSAECDSAGRQVRAAGARAGGRALGVLSRCSRVGPDVVADLWRRAPEAEITSAVALNATSRLRDRRVSAALRDAIRDGSRPRAVRLYALQNLIGFIDSARTADIALLADPRPRGRLLPALQYRTEHESVVAEQEIGDSDRQTSLAAIRRTGEGDSDPVVQRAAAFVYRELTDARAARQIGKDRP